MDDLYYSRVAMTGWVFAAFFALAILLSSDAAAAEFLALLPLADADWAALIVTALAGLGGPPAFGFVLEKVVDVFVGALGFSFRDIPAAEAFSRKLMEQWRKRLSRDEALRLPVRYAKGDMFHVFFYSYADEKFIAWCRRRRARMYASFSAALATLLATLVAALYLGDVSFAAIGISLAFIAAAMMRGIKEHWVLMGAAQAWVDAVGPRVIEAWLSTPSAAALHDPTGTA